MPEQIQYLGDNTEMRIQIAFILALTICAVTESAIAQTPATDPTVPDVSSWDECREYVPNGKPCKVIIEVAESDDIQHRQEAPNDVTITPGGKAAILMLHSSPFNTCTLTTSAAQLQRDVSQSFTTLLTSVGGLGAVAAAPLLLKEKIPGSLAEILKNQPHVKFINRSDLDQLTAKLRGKPEYSLAKQIAGQVAQMNRDLDVAQTTLSAEPAKLEAVQRVIKANYENSYSSDLEFKDAASKMWQSIHPYLNDGLPSLTTIEIELDGLKSALSKFHSQYDDTTNATVEDWINAADSALDKNGREVKLYEDQITDLQAARTQLKQLRDVLVTFGTGNTSESDELVLDKPQYTAVAIEMRRYAQKQITETLTCKDTLAQTPVFDNVVFTAYYESVHQWDFSAGAVLSLLGAHQVGPTSAPLAPDGTSATVLAVTSNSRVQWIPTTFIEYHPWNFECPWGKNGAPSHSFGYACSLGFAFGLALNPNNGATVPEYIEGISFGIHRVALIIGNHTGTTQDFVKRFNVGETVPSDAKPLTRRLVTHHPAFGISYRIPLR